LLAVRLIWILAVCWPLRQKAVFSLVRRPCFGRVGRVLVWPGPQLVGAKPCALEREHPSARSHPLLQRTMANDFSTMHCNGLYKNSSRLRNSNFSSYNLILFSLQCSYLLLSRLLFLYCVMLRFLLFQSLILISTYSFARVSIFLFMSSFLKKTNSFSLI